MTELEQLTNAKRMKKHGYDKILGDSFMPALNTQILTLWQNNANLGIITRALLELEVDWLATVDHAREQHKTVLFYDGFRRACQRYWAHHERSNEWAIIAALLPSIPTILIKAGVTYKQMPLGL